MSHLSEEELTILAERERNRTQLPLTNWESLSAQLREEGIIRDVKVRGGLGSPWMLRAAAALFLIAGGAVAGRLTIPDTSGSVGLQAASGPSRGKVAAASFTSEDSIASFRTEDEAWDVLNRAGADYQRASAFLAARDVNVPIDSTSVYQARLAALDGMAAASQKALYKAPHDPVINQYYLAAQGAKEATLRQLNTSLPTGMTLVKW